MNKRKDRLTGEGSYEKGVVYYMRGNKVRCPRRNTAWGWAALQRAPPPPPPNSDSEADRSALQGATNLGKNTAATLVVGHGCHVGAVCPSAREVDKRCVRSTYSDAHSPPIFMVDWPVFR